MLPSDYRRWLAHARTLTANPDEAADLLQSSLLAAVEASRFPLATPQDRAWFTSVLRRRAALLARTEIRRRQRDTASLAPPIGDPTAATPSESFPLPDLPPSLRAVAALVLAGMDRAEIAACLELSETAFRQRLAELRRRVRDWPEELRDEALARAYERRAGRSSDGELGLLRRALLACLRGAGGGLGAHDPDGHLFVVRARPRPDRPDEVELDREEKPGGGSRAEPPRQPSP